MCKMRWFKHLSTSQDDEVMSELIDEFGPAGYGIFWIVLEKISLNCGVGNETTSRYSAKRWANFAGCSAQYLRKVLRFLDERIPNFCVEDDGRYITIDCPNILKYRDEYTQKKQRSKDINSGYTPDPHESGETPKNVFREQRQTQRQRQTQSTETETETDVGYQSQKAKTSEEDPQEIMFQFPTKEAWLTIRRYTVDKWQRNMRYIDAFAELTGLEEWAWKINQEKEPPYANNKSAMCAISANLQRKNQKQLSSEQIRDPTHDPADPDGSQAAQESVKQTQETLQELSQSWRC